MQSSLWWICAKFDILHLTQPRNCAKATHVQSHLELVCERLITCLCLSFTSIFSESSQDHKLNWVLYWIFILPRQWVVCREMPSRIPQRRKAVSNRMQSEALVSTKTVETGWPRKISSQRLTSGKSRPKMPQSPLREQSTKIEWWKLWLRRISQGYTENHTIAEMTGVTTGQVWNIGGEIEGDEGQSTIALTLLAV